MPIQMDEPWLGFGGDIVPYPILGTTGTEPSTQRLLPSLSVLQPVRNLLFTGQHPLPCSFQTAHHLLNNFRGKVQLPRELRNGVTQWPLPLQPLALVCWSLR